MTDRARTEVLVFLLDDFGTRPEGQIAGALERAESGGAIRVHEALLVGRDAGTGGVTAVRAEGGTGGLLPALTAFRLDRERAWSGKAISDARGPEVDRLAGHLPPGSGIVALRLEHRWAQALSDGIGRAGGRLLSDEPAEPDPPPALERCALEVAQRAL